MMMFEKGMLRMQESQGRLSYRELNDVCVFISEPFNHILWNIPASPSNFVSLLTSGLRRIWKADAELLHIKCSGLKKTKRKSGAWSLMDFWVGDLAAVPLGL